ncbi:MAG: Beta-lactamase class C-like and penicillin binding proteins (PBPs) superfamily, partial [uncultured Gemmatimonadetes bacterium]
DLASPVPGRPGPGPRPRHGVRPSGARGLPLRPVRRAERARVRRRRGGERPDGAGPRLRHGQPGARRAQSAGDGVRGRVRVKEVPSRDRRAARSEGQAVAGRRRAPARARGAGLRADDHPAPPAEPHQRAARLGRGAGDRRLAAGNTHLLARARAGHRLAPAVAQLCSRHRVLVQQHGIQPAGRGRGAGVGRILRRVQPPRDLRAAGDDADGVARRLHAGGEAPRHRVPAARHRVSPADALRERARKRRPADHGGRPAGVEPCPGHRPLSGPAGRDGAAGGAGGRAPDRVCAGAARGAVPRGAGGEPQRGDGRLSRLPDALSAAGRFHRAPVQPGRRQSRSAGAADGRRVRGPPHARSRRRAHRRAGAWAGAGGRGRVRQPPHGRAAACEDGRRHAAMGPHADGPALADAVPAGERRGLRAGGDGKRRARVVAAPARRGRRHGDLRCRTAGVAHGGGAGRVRRRVPQRRGRDGGEGGGGGWKAGDSASPRYHDRADAGVPGRVRGRGRRAGAVHPPRRERAGDEHRRRPRAGPALRPGAV